MMSPNVRLLLALTGSVAIVSGLVPAARADTQQEIYNRIKNLEGRFNAPEPVGRATVGTFDVRTGEFTGKRSEVQFHTPPGSRKPVRTEITPALDINGVRARVRFKLLHLLFTGAVTITVNGHTQVPPAGTEAVSIGVGRARKVSWSITTSQGVEVMDKARIVRPRIVGAGVFTLQAVPVAVLYEPPPPADPALTQQRLLHAVEPGRHPHQHLVLARGQRHHTRDPVRIRQQRGPKERHERARRGAVAGRAG
jgi:hypothetical protein